MKHVEKLIKLSHTHYIVVDDSEIKEGEYAIDLCEDMGTKYEVFIVDKATLKYANQEAKKISHSTKPLEPLIKNNKHDNPKEFVSIKLLSLSEVEEAIYGYSVEKMVDKRLRKCNGIFAGYKQLYVDGFKAHQELTKDKLFTVDDIIQSLFPKTEWECTIDEQGKIKLL